MQRVHVIVRSFVSFDDDTPWERIVLEIVHRVTHHDFQSLTDHIRLNHVAGGFQRLNEPEDDCFIGQMPSEARTQRTAVEKTADSSAKRSPA